MNRDLSKGLIYTLLVGCSGLAGISAPYGVDMGAIALIVSMFLFLVISLASTPQRIDSDVETVMEL